MAHHYSRKMNIYATEFVPSSGSSSASSVKEQPTSNSSRRSSSTSAPNMYKNNNNSYGPRPVSSSQARPRKQEQRKKGKKEDVMVPAFINDYEPQTEVYGSPNKRGQISLNHLLGFQLPPRQRPGVSRSAVRRKSNVYYEPYNKERFVNANFRFVMDEKGDYTVNMMDPDIVVDWKDIVQAVVPIHNKKPPSCPICLSTPIAPKATKCGHVYCWPCITHYLHLGEKKWRKCPICYDAIYAKDLKPAKFAITQEVGKATPGKPAQVSMLLMKRAVNSTIALPRLAYHTWSNAGTNAPPSIANANAVPFAKLLLSSPEYLQIEILERERDELKAMFDEALNEEAVVKAVGGTGGGGLESEKPFIEVAMTEVKEALNALLKSNRLLGNTKGKSVVVPPVANLLASDEPPPPTWTDEVLDVQAKQFQEEQARQGGYEPAFSDDEEHDNTGSSPTKSPTKMHAQPSASKQNAPKHKNEPPQDGMYYFYQSLDGQHLYLHPLDIKILKHEYGSYDRFPDRINVNVIAAQESTMNEDLRKRCKYLSHVPLSCDVTFCEVDMKGLVSKSTSKVFEKELSQRLKRYRTLERKDQQDKDRDRKRSSPPLPLSSSWESPPSIPLDVPHAALDATPSSPPPSNPNSFARIAAHTTSTPTPWTRVPKPQPTAEEDDEYTVDEYQGWTLDFEEAVFGEGSKKRGKVVLVTNGGRRGRG
ncbi:uncharacterized protein SPPG_07919 [Spizellomyces punctatus DAOM BR117]|uniref:RING-type domain-containing protein n=1 Tax=Spizellomyces punctatus (strain DAOM BR117) TaxID=645134 RepID=A0A0L0H671_SPIPD|nr:uncharacterized protein SPPG_07919 [Spizellomyces punctatus DAOM BR117]KNC96707.1 hypothetical protein SPPG_07919 [Spizellomyces punctatus DAOM BR117]|eukprot:XP_016604747.1 hypothetical protein SPPG_07919 [Spizellomyces punctatus DAOM BR117]